MKKQTTPALHRGLTLIELVVVLAILITLAGLILPRLDFVRSQAILASTASNAGELASLIQTYKVSSSNNTYPVGDSLIDSSTALTSLFNAGPSAPLATVWSVPTAATGGSWYRSFLDGGLRQAYVMTPSPTDASNATTTTSAVQDLYTLASGAGVSVAALAYGANSPPSSGPGITYGPYNDSIVAAAFPTGTTYTGGLFYVPTSGTASVTAQLVVQGIGPQSGLIGTLLNTAPLDQQAGDTTTSIYSRYLAVYAIYGNGAPARLVMVTDHRGKPVSALKSDYDKARGSFSATSN